MSDISSSKENVGQSGNDFSDDVEEEEEEVDPRVQGELETLNSASDEINTLECELEKSRNKFRALLADSTQNLNALFKKLGKAVLKARPYYDLIKSSKEAQAEAQKAAVNFQRANSIYRAAKEMVQLAEERNFPEDGDKREFDSAWQEMLNHATMKFMESEKEKADSEENHLIKAAEYAAITEKVKFYEKDMPRTIKKAKPYFDLKDKLEKHLQVERMNVEDLQMGLMCAKHKYRSALTNLEAISEEIHRKRKRRLELPPRTPGVGAESISDLASLPSVNLDNLSDNGSFASMDDLDADGASLKGEIPDYEKASTSKFTEQAVATRLSDKMRDLSHSEPESSIGARGEAVAEGSESQQTVTEPSQPQASIIRTYKSTVHIGPLQSSSLYNPPVNSAAYYGRSNMPMAAVAMPTRGGVAIATQAPAGSRAHVPTLSSSSSGFRKEQRKLQTQKAFPILAGLTNSQNIARSAAIGLRPFGYQATRGSVPMPPRPQKAVGGVVAKEEKTGTNCKKEEEVFV